MKKYLFNLLSVLIFSMVSVNAGSGHGHMSAGFVEKLIHPYFQIQEGLAADNIGEARAGSEAFSKALKYGPSSRESTTVRVLNDYAGRIKRSDDIAMARVAFQRMSSEMQTLVKNAGSGIKTDVFVAYCPMAFDNEGGAWLQKDKTVNNPYYGSMMLRCGSIKSQLAGGGHDDHGHSGHDHGHGDHHGSHGNVEKPADARQVTIIAKDFKFEPAAVSARPGEKLFIELINKGTQAHMWEITGVSGTHIHAEVGKTAKGVVVVPNQPGTYKTYCSAPGHTEAGMVGILQVSGASAHGRHDSHSNHGDDHSGHKH